MRKTTKTVLSVATALVITAGFSGKAEAASYKVQSGDSLWSIAQKHDTSISSLKSINNLTSNTIYINQILETSKMTESTTHTVRSGDSLWAISREYNVSVSQLINWNNKSNSTIYVGEKLVISNSNSQPNPTQVNVTAYKVSAGDSLYFIAKRYGVSINNIKAWNNLSSDTIYVGQVLRLTAPAQSTQPKIEQEKSISVGEKAIEIGKKYLGVPYVWGGKAPSGFDCSGFIYYVFNQAGMDLDRASTTGLYEITKAVSNPTVGDLVFFSGTYRSGISHVGIYMGNNEFIHAKSSGGISITSLDNSYWRAHSPEFRQWK
ncbi:LysM peptidoglycan-binding domain-containing protein [Radiobacillus sp. PE A8.2]|uniref:C40 family peptidase n=1 Tax=Radiobacillus sp. PE A8.2 TaxID=3380349 RepID=UPI003890F84B